MCNVTGINIIILIRFRSSFLSRFRPLSFSKAFLASNALTAAVLFLTLFFRRPKRDFYFQIDCNIIDTVTYYNLIALCKQQASIMSYHFLKTPQQMIFHILISHTQRYPNQKEFLSAPNCQELQICFFLDLVLTAHVSTRVIQHHSSLIDFFAFLFDIGQKSYNLLQSLVICLA